MDCSERKVAALRAKPPPNEQSKKRYKVIAYVHEGETKWDPEIASDRTAGFDLKPELFAGLDPTRGLDQEAVGISRVGSGPMGSGGFQTLTDRVGPSVVDPRCFDPTRSQAVQFILNPAVFFEALRDPQR